MKNQKRKKKTSSLTSSRKQSHVELVAAEDVGFQQVSSGFERYQFIHNALPEIALRDVDTSLHLLSKDLKVPVLISSMTGGYEDAERINRAFAILAGEFGAAMAVGSQRQALENKKFHESFKVARKENPKGLIFSNIGGVEVAKLLLKRNIHALEIITEQIEADALIIHLNPLQELLQPEGEPDFKGVLRGIEWCVKQLPVPVIVKEVGAGISKEVAGKLINAGARVIDVAGAGGTSWAGVEILRRNEEERTMLEPFWDWGIPTAEALMRIRELKLRMTFGIIASGGISSGIDVAKSIALGADIAGIAKPFIKTFLEKGEPALHEQMKEIILQLRYSMFLTGSENLAALSKQQLIKY